MIFIILLQRRTEKEKADLMTFEEMRVRLANRDAIREKQVIKTAIIGNRNRYYDNENRYYHNKNQYCEKNRIYVIYENSYYVYKNLD